jgi:hypothetical protein
MGMLIALTRRRPQARVDAEQPAPNFYAESLAR